MVVSRICKLAFYHFTAIKESNGCVLRLLSEISCDLSWPQKSCRMWCIAP